MRVFCVACDSHIYDTDHGPIPADEIRPEDFRPATPEIRRPMPHDECLCPLCSEPLIMGDIAGYFPIGMRFEDDAE